jgi:hypothetical protein
MGIKVLLMGIGGVVAIMGINVVFYNIVKN